MLKKIFVNICLKLSMHDYFTNSVFSPGILAVVAMPVALFSIQHFFPEKSNSSSNSTHLIEPVTHTSKNLLYSKVTMHCQRHSSLYKLYIYRFYSDPCLRLPQACGDSVVHLNLIMETKHLIFMIAKSYNTRCQLLKCNSTENQIDTHLKLLVFLIQFFSQATNPLL